MSERTLNSRGYRFRDVDLSTDAHIRQEDLDLDWFELCHLHGPQTTRSMFETTKLKGRKNFSRARDRMKWLRHEERSDYGGKTLFVPDQQTWTVKWERNVLVYDLRKPAEQALKNAGRWHENAPRAADNMWWHDLGVSSVTSSIDLGTRRKPEKFGYLHNHEVYERIRTKAFPIEYDYKGVTYNRLLRPDRFGGIRFLPNDDVSPFILEFDRSTERNRTEDINAKSHEHMLVMYEELIGNGLYKQYYGSDIPLLVLFVFTNEVKMRNVMNLALEISQGEGYNYMLFKCWPAFAGKSRHPDLPRFDLFTGGWERPGRDPYYLNDPDGLPS